MDGGHLKTFQFYTKYSLTPAAREFNRTSAVPIVGSHCEHDYGD